MDYLKGKMGKQLRKMAHINIFTQFSIKQLAPMINGFLLTKLSLIKINFDN